MTVVGAGATKEPSSEELSELMDEGAIGAEGEAKEFGKGVLEDRRGG